MLALPLELQPYRPLYHLARSFERVTLSTLGPP